MRLGVVGACVLVATALLFAAPAGASPNARYGIMDDAWLLNGPGTLPERVATLDDLGVRLVRFTLRWDRIAPTRPADARDADDPAYRWGQYATVLEGLHEQGISALVTLYGSPSWANGGHLPGWLPRSGFGNFAYAAAKRFPWVHMWTAWNEPNGRTFAVPVSPRLYVQRVLNPAYAALHEASSANRVAGGVTSPRQTPTGMAPLEFLQGMSDAHAHLDAYAHNPYPTSRGETPDHSTCYRCTDLTMAKLPAIRAAVTHYFGGSKQLWLTEYGYQTNPPDRIVKPAYRAFAFPLAEISRSGSRVSLWGQVRPGSGRRPYRLQRYSGGWRSVGGTMRTDASGTLRLTVTLARGTRVRIWSPQTEHASPALTIS